MRHKALPFHNFALVTGASSGIGLAITEHLAARGAKLILLSNEEAALSALKSSLFEKHESEVHTLCMDLSEPHAAQKVWDFTQEHRLDVDMLVNNVGFFTYSHFSDMAMERMHTMLALHVQFNTELTYFFVKPMMERKRGYIINMSSLSAFWPMPGITLYNSTKSYLRNFSISLHFELKRLGINVTAMCPGGVDTPLLKISDKQRALYKKLGFLSSPERIAKLCIHANLKGAKQSLGGPLSHVLNVLVSLAPDFILHKLSKKYLPIKSIAS